MQISRPPSAMQMFVTGIVYFATATATLLTSRFEGGLAFIWMANAFLVVELLATDRRHWWKPVLACSIASAIATTLFGMGPIAALPMVVMNMVEALLVAALFLRVGPADIFAGSMRPLAMFVLALCSANLVVALGAAAVASTVTANGFWQSWLQWYSGHVLGGLTFTPMLALLKQRELSRWMRETPTRAKVEAAVLLLLFAALCWRVFYQAPHPMLFLPMLPLVLLSFRIGHLGASAAIIILAVIGGTATLQGFGPINMIDATVGMRVQYLQLYLAFCFLISMPVAAELNGRKRLFQLLRDSEARYRILADHSGDVVLNISVPGIVQYASPSVTEHFGLLPDEMLNHPAIDFVHRADRGLVAASHGRALAEPGEVQMVEFRPLRTIDDNSWCEMVTRAILNERGIPAGVVSTIRDMTRHKVAQRELQTAANIDELTGAATRRALMERLEAEIGRVGRNVRTCIALIDIDHFKRVNDEHGHGAGDMVLRRFVECLRPGVRGSDLIGRLGGEEFAIILPDVDLSQASVICERLRMMVAAMKVPLDDHEEIRITFSAGLIELDGALDGAAALDAADKALYEAKRSGRNCVRLAA